MTESPDWPSAFVAVSVILGEPRDAAAAALGEAATVSSAGLTKALQSASRDVRARAVARVIAAVAAELDAARLA
jgi:hypothetical protein